MNQEKNTMFMRMHPFVNMVYFLGVMTVIMLSMHPVLLGGALLICFVYSVYLMGRKGFLQNIKLLPFIVLVSFINPVFNHVGRTVLFQVKGYPFTLEAFFFGFASALMIYDMILLFRCFHIIMTSDKVILIGSHIFPLGALLFTMTLRFVPMYMQQIQKMQAARLGIGQGEDKKRIDKIRSGAELIFGLFTWSLENALETAESMKGRGFGLEGRTYYSRNDVTRLDKMVLIWEVICLAGLVYFAVTNSFGVSYYPTFSWTMKTMKTKIGCGVFLTFASTPLLIDGKEEIIWRYLRQNI